MAREQEQPTVNVNDLAAAFSAALQSVKPEKELKEGDPEYVARQHAEGWYDDFFGVKVYQNAFEAQARGESLETRERVGLLRPGKYLKGRVTVDVHGNTLPDGRHEIVRFLYPISGANDPLINQQHFSSFGDLVNKIWQEMHATVAA